MTPVVGQEPTSLFHVNYFIYRNGYDTIIVLTDFHLLTLQKAHEIVCDNSATHSDMPLLLIKSQAIERPHVN